MLNKIYRFFKWVFKLIFDFHERKKQLLDLILIAFLVTFALARIWSIWVGNAIYIYGFHIHHFYFGMFILSLGGVIALLGDDIKIKQYASVMLGVGIGLFADEIGLLLNCTTADRVCAYAFPDTTEIVGSIALVLILILLTVDFIDRRKIKKSFQNAKDNDKIL